MNNNKYMTIKEFALKVGITPQAVYKQIDKKLNNYVKIIDNQKMIDIKAIQEVYGIEVKQQGKQQEQPKVEEVENIVNQNRELIDLLKQQLIEKDKEIENLHKLLDQEQQLNAMNQQKILALESRQEEEQKQKEAASEQEERNNNKKSLGFWGRLFKR